MKIKTWIKYEESYIPPRCRKPRYSVIILGSVAIVSLSLLTS